MFLSKLEQLIEPNGDINYIKKYLDICNKQSREGIMEKHHILPRKQFPEYSKEDWNIVNLSTKNHLKAHYYLALGVHGIVENFKYMPFWQSVNLMYNTRDFDGKLSDVEIEKYSIARDQAIISLTKLNKERDSSVGTEIRLKERRKKEIIGNDGLNSWQRAGKKSAETLGKDGLKKRMEKAKETALINGSYKLVGEKNSAHSKRIEENGLTVAQNRAIKGHKTRNENSCKLKETKLKQSLIAKNRKKIICEHCNKNVDVSNFSRWHGNNCKMKVKHNDT